MILKVPPLFKNQTIFLFIEEMRNNKRMIAKAVRNIDRERKKGEAQEAKHMKEI